MWKEKKGGEGEWGEDGGRRRDRRTDIDCDKAGRYDRED